MHKKDLVIGIVGATILVAAMVGVFRYEAARASGAGFDVAWDTQTLVGPSASGVTQEGDETAGALEVSARNVTRATFTLAWTDDAANSAPDEFELVVVSPAGIERSARSDGGSVEVVFDDVAPVPAPQTVLAGSEAEARERVESGQSSAAGTGEWTFRVRLLQAGDLTAPAGGVVLQEDAQNAWELTSSLETYEATFTA